MIVEFLIKSQLSMAIFLFISIIFKIVDFVVVFPFTDQLNLSVTIRY